MGRFCKNCGNKLDENSKFCTKCGYKTVITPNVISNNNTVNILDDKIKSRNKTIAIIGFVCSLSGIIIFGILLGIIAVSLGITALKNTKIFKIDEGKGFAIASIVIGCLDVVLVIVGLLLQILIN